MSGTGGLKLGDLFAKKQKKVFRANFNAADAETLVMSASDESRRQTKAAKDSAPKASNSDEQDWVDPDSLQPAVLSSLSVLVTDMKGQREGDAVDQERDSEAPKCAWKVEKVSKSIVQGTQRLNDKVDARKFPELRCQEATSDDKMTAFKQKSHVALAKNAFAALEAEDESDEDEKKKAKVQVKKKGEMTAFPTNAAQSQAGCPGAPGASGGSKKKKKADAEGVEAPEESAEAPVQPDVSSEPVAPAATVIQADEEKVKAKYKDRKKKKQTTDDDE